MKPAEVRDTILRRLKQDLIGPHSEDEVLEARRIRPSDVYLTGILWPHGERMGAADDDQNAGDGDDDEAASAPPVGQQRPCSMGISFTLAQTDGEHRINAEISFATYVKDAPSAPPEGPKLTRWSRKPFVFHLENFVLPTSGDCHVCLFSPELAARVDVHARACQSSGKHMATVTLINRSELQVRTRDEVEHLTLFQTRLTIAPGPCTHIIPHPPRPSANDEDEEISRLLYRNTPEFATGHQCSSSWQDDGGLASCISTEWIPVASATAFREDGDTVFAELGKGGGFNARELAEASDSELIQALEQLPAAYEIWIRSQTERLKDLHPDLAETGRKNLANCTEAMRRIRSGISALKNNEELRQSFRLANAAMALQHSWKPGAAQRPLCWRPFQLGFILLAAESACIPEAEDRNILDLLWFPTGGGKTEAYLALVAILAFHRRLSCPKPGQDAGNAAVMRYTLRLLTAQQFERATSLILACELIRKGDAKTGHHRMRLGTTPFSIGLWVGGDATPNDFEKARAHRGNKEGATAEQIDECPCCHGRVAWHYDDETEKVEPYCRSESCSLGTGFGLWPVYTVDSDIYRVRPTLLIGTIDKFALLTTKEDVGRLFSFGTTQAPDLIIQDELHLISGPLGTIAGAYETAFDWLLRKGNCRPKIIGSTATIRRAADQVKALFDRQSRQFPPPGLDHDNSGFAVRDESKPPRLYLGVTTAGRSAKFTFQATIGSLLQSAGPTSGIADKDRDGYATLLAYFNSLRELGGAIVQVLDDAPDAIKLYAGHHGEAERILTPPRELTSRVSQREIIEILSELKTDAGQDGAVDIVLATNMVSVGVDVSRLGLMVMNGQPKTRSEYIQATSRVGRSNFPGLIVSILNAAKPRDRSHFETFPGWHAALYRDVEPTSVTPFAARARDRALHAALVAMIRHGEPSMTRIPDLSNASDTLLNNVVDEIERRVSAVDPHEQRACSMEIDERLHNWQDRSPSVYINAHKVNHSLLISADQHALRKASGRLPAEAWPTMNNMRSVEASTRFRMVETLAQRHGSGDEAASRPAPRWRRNNGQ